MLSPLLDLALKGKFMSDVPVSYPQSLEASYLPQAVTVKQSQLPPHRIRVFWPSGNQSTKLS